LTPMNVFPSELHLVLLPPVRSSVPPRVGPSKTGRPKSSKRMQGMGQSYSPPSYFDTGWASVFVAGCEAIGANPYDVAALIIGESGWYPGAVNPSSGNIGLNQLTSAPVDGYADMTVSEQLPWVFDYWVRQMQQAGLISISARDLYWLNWVPALYVPFAPDSYVIQNQGDPYYSADLDIGGKGYITAGDLQTRLDNMKANNPDLYSYLAEQITLAGGPVAYFPWPWLAAGSFAAGFAGFFLMQKYGRPRWVPSWVPG
jgi:hypothetical protein